MKQMIVNNVIINVNILNMICEICSSFKGDKKDDVIRFLTGHHLLCCYFDTNILINNVEEIQESELINESKSSIIVRKLYKYYCDRYFPIVPNIYIYNWESDILMKNKENNYITEYEIKISRSDFKADFKKIKKHQLLLDSYTYKFSAELPNYFYYATPPGLLNKSEIPKYAGLIEAGITCKIIKKAPLIHNDEIDQSDKTKMLEKIYQKYWTNRLD